SAKAEAAAPLGTAASPRSLELLDRLFLGRPAAGLDVLVGWFAASPEDVSDEEVVDHGPDTAAEQRPDYRYPEIGVDVPVVAREGDLVPAGDGREDARTEVAGRVDRVAGVCAERDSHRNDHKADQERGEVRPHWLVELVDHGEHERHQERRANHLV